MDYKYAYLILTLLVGVIWIIIFVKRKDLRKEMLLTSLFISLFGFTELMYYGEYWTPQWVYQFPGLNIGIEDFLLTFFYGGIAGSLYEFVFKKHIFKTGAISKKEGLLESLSWIFLGIIVFLLLEMFTDLNIIYTTSIALLNGGTFFLFFRKDLIKVSLYSGIISGVLFMIIVGLGDYLFPGFVEFVWNTDILLGIEIIGAPIEEFIFHFALGFTFGPAYEVLNGLRNG